MVWVVFVVLAAIAILLKASGVSNHHAADWPTVSKPVLTNHEQPAFWALQKALPDHVVLAQVQLSQFLSIKGTHRRQAWLNRIQKKSADFLICRKDFSVLAVIELDDSTHNRQSRRKADADKDAAVSAAGLKIIRWRSLPDQQGIKTAVLG